MDKQEIYARFDKLKARVREKREGQKDRIDRVKELFLKLKEGFKYMEKNPDNVEKNQRLIERAKPIFDELETLGVSQEFSKALLIMGGIVDNPTVEQFIE